MLLNWIWNNFLKIFTLDSSANNDYYSRMLKEKVSDFVSNVLIGSCIAFIGGSLGWMMASGNLFVSVFFAAILGWIIGAIYGQGRY